MTEKKDYPAVDCFRLIAAILVVTIHTSPLLDISEAADFVLTRVISRVAVPFFFMTSGFFTLSRYENDGRKLKAFIKETLIIYGISVLIYLPVNIYSGYFQENNKLPLILKDIIFDGTFYHLWYLPAAALGAAISFFLIKKFAFKGALIAAGILYVFGLFGDSYYGIIEKIPWLRAFYRQIFYVTDYTRNGIFYAPIFFVTGACIAEIRERMRIRAWLAKDGASGRRGEPLFLAAGFILCMGLMSLEALILRKAGVQRHDSMYVMLPAVMFFLFAALTYFRGRRFRLIRTAALIVYLIHPMVIIAVRFAAHVTNTENLLIENSLIHFIAVAAISLIAGLAGGAIRERIRGRKAGSTPYAKTSAGEMRGSSASEGLKPTKDTCRSWIEVDLDNLSHNARVLQEAMPEGCELMAVVKDRAYGHGAPLSAARLERSGVGAFAVATADEGIELRKSGIRGMILVLGYTDPIRVKDLVKYHLTQTAVSLSHARELNETKKNLDVHLKIDTGMHRIGIAADDFDAIEEVFAMKHLRVRGMYTHLCCADSKKEEDIDFTRGQIEKFFAVTEHLKKKGIPLPKIHIQGTFGLLNFPDVKCDYARMGIALYGVLSTPNDRCETDIDLRPALSLKARVIHIEDVKKGESVSYGRTFVAERDSRIALLAVGYGDGFPRALSGGKSPVIIEGRTAPIVGRICMDQLAVDVTDIDGVGIRSVATLVGGEGKISAPAVADSMGSISNELFSRLGGRLPVVGKTSL